MQASHQLEAATPPYKHAYPALMDFLNESIVKSLEYKHQPLSFFAALKKIVYTEGKVSKKTLTILGASITIGTIAGYFYINPSGNGADTIINILKEHLDYDFPGSEALRYLMQSTSTGENIFVSTYSAMLLFQAYSNQSSAAVKFLHYHDATRAEKFRNFWRKVFDLLCAACANIPTFLLSKDINLSMAILTSLANMALSWKGVSNFNYQLTMMPARRALINYIDTQINYFLTSPPEEKKMVINNLTSLCRNHNQKKLFYYLLNLGEPVFKKPHDHRLYLQKPYSRPVYGYVPPVLTGGFGLFAELSFVAATAYYIPQLFADPSSIESIATTTVLVAMSLLPGIGFGGKGGFNAGLDATSRTPLLPHYGMPITHGLTQWLVRALTLFSGGATFAIAHDTTQAFATAQQFSNVATDVCKYLFAGAAYVGSTIMNGYYTSCLLDTMKIYFGLECGNETIHRLFSFTEAMREMQRTFTSMTDEALIDCLQNLLLPSDSTATDDMAISNLLYAIFYHDLSKKEYAALEKEINECKKHEAPKQLMKRRDEAMPANVIESFFTQPTTKSHWCFGIFDKTPNTKRDASLVELPQLNH